ncbi:MAG TPA: ATP-grasp domain-containing protein [Acidimicrobiia bacterium]|nr:ATP-grasp domain-containing protein [Acidimicrobiia bacterium]
MSVLISSAGRRTSLVEAFIEACHPEQRVIAADVDALAPALFVADEAVVVPSLDHPDFLDYMLEACARYDVKVVVPTIDTELMLFARNRDRFAKVGVVPLVSSETLIEMTMSKRKTEGAFTPAGIRTPRSWEPTSESRSDLPYEIFVKPDRGSASAHTYSTTPEHLMAVLPLVPDPIVQEKINAVEVTVDALLDPGGVLIHLVPRLRLKTVGGESVQGVTTSDQPIRVWLSRVFDVVAGLGGWGPMTVQLFLTDPAPTLVEVNPRFGGGFPLAYRAGARYPQWILRMLEGEGLEPCLGGYRKGLFMTRSLSEHFVDGNWEQ